MNVKSIERNGNEATIVVEIDKDLMESGVNKSYLKARKQIMIPGFRKGLEKSAFGVVGIETAFPILYTYLVKPGILSMERLVQLLCDNPRKRFHLPLGCDYSIWDLEAEETVNPETFLSMGKATPFAGWKVSGKCMATVCGGEIVYRA